MSVLELIIISIGLSMDAFAVSICKGLSLESINYKNAFITGIFFGVFQALMPLLGFLIGIQFKSIIMPIDHWIAFIMLSGIGMKMIIESQETGEVKDCGFSFKSMTFASFATSIDALVVGITFAFLKVSILPAILLIGVITFILSFVGVNIGCAFRSKFKSKAEIAGGIILILMGLKILLEHLGIIGF